MTYASILEAYGWERFERRARSAGATSMIVADLPCDERPGLRRVQLVAPTSTDERIRVAAERPTAGSTSSASPARPAPATALFRARAAGRARARGRTDVPLYAGFGISTPEHARAATELADGIAVGSRAVEVAEQGPAALREFVASLREAIDT